jgi:RNA polymerase sigma-70 factor, ECF subfamily
MVQKRGLAPSQTAVNARKKRLLARCLSPFLNHAGVPDAPPPKAILVMSRQQHDEEFCRRLVDVQRGLFGYILRLLPDATDASDVLQETNAVILRKEQEFRAGTDFAAWAAGIARHQVLAFRRDVRRERLVFSDQLLDQLATRTPPQSDDADAMFEAMELCRVRLTEADQWLLESRYADNVSVAEIARTTGRTPHAVSQSLYRIRLTLLQCIQLVLASQENTHVAKPGS